MKEVIMNPAIPHTDMISSGPFSHRTFKALLLLSNYDDPLIPLRGRPAPPDAHPTSIEAYPDVVHPPHLNRLKSGAKREAHVEPLSIQVGDDGTAPHSCTFLRASCTPRPRTTASLPSSFRARAAGSRVRAASTFPRVQARHPGYCVEDVRAAMAFLRDMYGIERFILVGWSFGGAPVFTVSGADDEYGRSVIACATVASQTAETKGIRHLAPRPLLLLHGTADRTLSPRCSQQLYYAYGEEGDRKIHLFEGDNHALMQNPMEAEEMLCEFIARCAGLKIKAADKVEVVEQKLVENDERDWLMTQGGDLRPPEHKE
ncbi:unnamed protein product [Parascedosporium putredinis]|uniref:AB hydrolase-1 domain-containing protein n=1 Tax=Parascedosporium putredinis TaxID=1442378 RepID=A0A9P1MA96_9PEZI|nr:unnamed protein product [Parascedosporium putredinis]CAI7993620.1 unnamed protein product [Parascedosporium putredinis]